MDNIQLVEKKYDYVWPNDSTRNAEIVFSWDDKVGCFQFSACAFNGVGKIYSIDDWRFLHDLSTAILALNKEASLT